MTRNVVWLISFAVFPGFVTLTPAVFHQGAHSPTSKRTLAPPNQEDWLIATMRPLSHELLDGQITLLPLDPEFIHVLLTVRLNAHQCNHVTYPFIPAPSIRTMHVESFDIVTTRDFIFCFSVSIPLSVSAIIQSFRSMSSPSSS